MSERDDLLRHVIDHPDDDAPRLVFADWLDEQGDHARAEFIRVQCRLAALPEDDPDRPALARRETDLEIAHRDKWLGPLAKFDNAGLVKFRRGFLDEVCVLDPDASFADNDLAPLPFAAPLLSELRVGQRSEVTDAGLAHLAGMVNLRQLDLGECGISDAGLEHLSGLPLLRYFQVYSERLTDHGRAALDAARQAAFNRLPAGRRRSAALRELPADLRPGAGSHALLGGESVDDRTLSHLSGLDDPPDLFFVELWRQQVSGDGLRHLHCFPNLGRLVLSESWVEDLTGLAGMTSLRRLDLGGTRHLTDAGTAALATLTGLEELSLSGSGVGDDTFARLAGLPRLETLSLGTWDDEPPFTVAGLMSLAHLPTLRSLEVFCPSGLEAGLAALAAMPSLRVLRLVLQEGPLDRDAVIDLLSRCRGLVELELESRDYGEVTAGMVGRLADALPQTSLVSHAGCRLPECRHVIEPGLRRHEVGGCSLDVPESWEPRPCDHRDDPGGARAVSLRGLNPDFCPYMAGARLMRWDDLGPEDAVLAACRAMHCGPTDPTHTPPGVASARQFVLNGIQHLAFAWPSSENGSWTLGCRAGPDRFAAWEPVFRRMAASFRPDEGG